MFSVTSPPSMQPIASSMFYLKLTWGFYKPYIALMFRIMFASVWVTVRLTNWFTSIYLSITRQDSVRTSLVAARKPIPSIGLSYSKSHSVPTARATLWEERVHSSCIRITFG
jgi:hypothetical protein